MYLPSIGTAAPPALGVNVAAKVPRANAQSPPTATSWLVIVMLKANRSNTPLFLARIASFPMTGGSFGGICTPLSAHNNIQRSMSPELRLDEYRLQMSLIAAVAACWSPGACLEHAACKGSAAARIQSVTLSRERLVMVSHSPIENTLEVSRRVPPNGSRLSCGRPARRRKCVGRSPCPAKGTTLRFP